MIQKNIILQMKNGAEILHLRPAFQGDTEEYWIRKEGKDEWEEQLRSDQFLSLFDKGLIEINYRLSLHADVYKLTT